MKTILLFCAGAAAFLAMISPQRLAAEAPDRARLSLAAGYKAAFTCSATFNAGRPPEQIARDELDRIYGDFVEAMAALPEAIIDEKTKTATVAFADDLPPRAARWRPHLGCAQLPAGARAAADFPLPGVSPRTQPAGAPLEVALSNDPGIAAIVDAAFDAKTYGEGSDTTAILIMREGKIIAEKYREGFDAGTPQRTWSVAKSIAATVLGAAVREGLIAVEAPARLAAWSAPGDPRGAITLENLLHMASGLTQLTPGNRTDAVYFGGGRVVDHAITNRLVASPGARWRYANNDTMAAMRALREAIADDDAYWRFPFENVLHPIGMRNTFLETDWNGDFVMSSQVWTTARDLARLGLLHLNDGVWEGVRILPEGWTSYVATPAPAQPPRRETGPARPGYGAQWWLYGEAHAMPQGTYAARGNRGQYLFIIPARNILVIRRGFDGRPGEYFDVDQFVRDVLAALPE